MFPLGSRHGPRDVVTIATLIFFLKNEAVSSYLIKAEIILTRILLGKTSSYERRDHTPEDTAGPTSEVGREHFCPQCSHKGSAPWDLCGAGEHVTATRISCVQTELHMGCHYYFLCPLWAGEAWENLGYMNAVNKQV